MTLLGIAGHLPGAKLRGNELRAHCPACESSRDDALSVEIKDEKVLVHCFAHECAHEEIMGHLRQLEVPSSRSSKSRVVETYNYTDGNGELLYAVERLEPKSFRQKRWTKTGWNYKLGDVPRVLYALPRVLDALDHERTVFLVEGEKDVLTLESMGFTATTCAGGAQSWTRGLATQLRGGNIVAIADNDEAGEKWWAKVEATLQVSAASLRRCHLPGVKQGGDITDWMEDHTVEEFEALLNQPEEPKASVAAGASGKKSRGQEMIWIDEPDLRAKEFPPTKWYAKNFLHQGTAILGGRPKQGKSWLALNIAINLATGTDVMGHYAVEESHKVAFFTLEDSERLLRQRIIKLATDPVPNLRVVTQTAKIDDGFLDDVKELMAAGFKIFIIDVLAKIEPVTTKSSDGYRDTYQRLDPVKSLCEENDAAMILITHTRKMHVDNHEENIMGSTAYTANPDMVWVLEREGDTAFLSMKSKEMEPKILEIRPLFDGSNWEIVEDGTKDSSVSGKDKEVIDLMKEDYSEITPNQLAREFGITISAATKRLRRMHQRGLIRKIKRGVYGLNDGTFEHPPHYREFQDDDDDA